ncbi:hypothetical protein WMY93_005970 [Mugilogobius chulae]|uniref:Thioredoxin domain-containing protein n=1 Tax=Mugilogobius chulae TaxID=88201 RepID=A0AAW0PJA1_9GOBI
MDRSLVILGVVTFCVCASAGDTHATSGEEGILQLNTDNFSRALRENRQLLVHFFIPMTADVHKVSEIFQEAAAQLQGSEIKFAVVDAVKEKDLAKELNATEPPFIRLYLSGDKHNPVHCPVPKTSSSILTWLKRRQGSPVDLMTDTVQIDSDLLVLGFFKELNDAYIQVFYEAAVDLPDLTFALTKNEDVVSKYGLVNDDVVVVLKKSRLMQAYRMRPEVSKEELLLFITVFQMDPVTEYSGQTASQILSSPILNHALLFISKTSPDFETIYAAFNRTAAAFRLKILFVLVNVDESRNGRLLEYFRVRDFEAPLIRIVNLTNHPKMQSEPVPDDWDQTPVKQLVGSTLERVAFHPNKTVFVLFYLPYSSESRAVFPLWEELAEAFKDQEDIVIARMDASANDINMSMLRQYPSLCLFPALYSEREDESRRKYMETVRREEEAKKPKQNKLEL